MFELPESQNLACQMGRPLAGQVVQAGLLGNRPLQAPCPRGLQAGYGRFTVAPFCEIPHKRLACAALPRTAPPLIPKMNRNVYHSGV